MMIALPRLPLFLVLALSVLASNRANTASATSALPPDAQPIEGLGYALPVASQAPPWYDDEFHQRVLAAGEQGVALPEGATFTAAGSADLRALETPPVGIGPGTWLLTVFTKNGVPSGFTWCTANFVFTSGSSFGLGTAGHCTGIAGAGNVVTAFVVPPPDVCLSTGVCAPGIYRIGQFTSIIRDNGVGDDFALIAIDANRSAWMRPTMAVFGGPTGAYRQGLVRVDPPDPTVGPATLLTPAHAPAALGHCGHGLAVGTGGTCRVALGLFESGTAYAWYGAAAPGDSGSGVVLAGHADATDATNVVPAAANLTHIIILDANLRLFPKTRVSVGPFFTGMVAGTSMNRILALVGSSWSLVPGVLDSAI